MFSLLHCNISLNTKGFYSWCPRVILVFPQIDAVITVENLFLKLMMQIKNFFFVLVLLLFVSLISFYSKGAFLIIVGNFAISVCF